MQKLTTITGFLLIVVAVVAFFATGHSHPTALIPGGFGIVLQMCGLAAGNSDGKKKALWSHIAVTLGLLGFLGTAAYVLKAIRLLHGASFEHPIAVEEKAAMSIILFVFTLLCVRSFIAARQARNAAAENV